ncbi:exopolysaccharide biosynthesis protein [Stappia stellulata]|uniref:exopolysaccharide biosynthesis protein n=1 Tax=Stappia stellulata TaxID=71235 RepID=UPI0004109098|nr:exopolysaccharide biosynthesis protein [Stappia stellulata]
MTAKTAKTAKTEETHTTTGVLDAWEREVRQGRSDVDSIMRATGSRAAGPLLFLPALVMISPVGAVPGVPIVLSTLVVFVAAQILFGARSIWLPTKLRDRSIPEEKVSETIDWLRPGACRVDRILGQRLSGLTGDTMVRTIAALCIVLAGLVYPATLLPFAAALPGGAILLLALGLLSRDGVVILVGLVATAGAIATVVVLTL